MGWAVLLNTAPQFNRINWFGKWSIDNGLGCWFGSRSEIARANILALFFLRSRSLLMKIRTRSVFPLVPAEKWHGIFLQKLPLKVILTIFA